ncbi:T9SS type A sorting domain-containing protein [Hymenobacter metallicola]|uniref:T9SS type A sorting domain-containing protein n=1 Tax=Hymenobacter metallicola TaxID=2563114 RepID=A0A4Z0Q9U7_9BACT|nr:T9SS type A sorting domain-containing protein [Hymenobacter metallicola]TGE26484.1 T9SS type A sorting domain-containing protein [Hymenobacter metallicola]
MQQFSDSQRPTPRGRGLESEEEEEEERRPDRPDLAQEQEAALTRDPRTGTVPRERLIEAKAQIDELLELRASQRAIGGSLSAANWTEKGPSNIAGRVRAIMPDPSDATGNKVWAGSVGGGLWKSNNAAGASPTWSKVSDTFANMAISTLAYDPTNTDIMYFGTGEGFGNADAIRGLGIWKSTDHGVTWTQLASTNAISAFYYVNRIVVDKNGWVYAATNTGGLRRSKDQGASWEAVAFSTNSASDVDVNPTDGTVYLTVGNSTTGGGIFRSSTGNSGSFTNLNTLTNSGLPPSGTTLRVELAIAPSNPAQMYALFCSSGAGTPAVTRNTLYGIYRSLDGGNTWQALPKPNDADPGIPDADFTRTQAWYDLAVSVSPTDPNTVFVGAVDIFKTSNGATTNATDVAWQQVTHWYGGFGFQEIHADQHAVVFVSGTHAYFGNDGGVARSTNATATIPTLTHINTGFNITQFYSVAVHPTNTSYFLAGAQDNGTQQFGVLSGTNTQDVIGGDGAFCFIDEDNPQYQFGTYVYSNIYRSSNGGTSFPTTLVADNNGSFINPMEYDSKANALYYAYTTGNLRRTLQATGTPVSASISLVTSSVPAPGVVTHVAVSPNVDNRVYVGTNAGKIFRVDNANTATPTVTPIYTTGPTGVSISGIAIERSAATPDPDQHILATVSNYGVTSVWQTTNGGTSWASAEGNLPDMPVRWVVFDPTGGKRAMLATELGVWTTDDLTAAAVTWQPSNTNLANVRVDMLRIRKNDRIVAAATHGRGVFTSDVFVVNPLPVQLTSFTGQSTDRGVALRWQTASERNTSRFEIERSAGGKPFHVLGRKAAAGTSTTARSYSYVDETVAAGTYAYRLHQLDQDGSATYSPIVTVQVKSSGAAWLSNVYPNPVVQDLTVELAEVVSSGTTVSLSDVQGRVVYQSAATPNTRTIRLRIPSSVRAGTYTLTVRAAGQHATKQVVIQR